jgi:hypothetical protein
MPIVICAITATQSFKSLALEDCSFEESAKHLLDDDAGAKRKDTRKRANLLSYLSPSTKSALEDKLTTASLPTNLLTADIEEHIPYSNTILGLVAISTPGKRIHGYANLGSMDEVVATQLFSTTAHARNLELNLFGIEGSLCLESSYITYIHPKRFCQCEPIELPAHTITAIKNVSVQFLEQYKTEIGENMPWVTVPLFSPLALITARGMFSTLPILRHSLSTLTNFHRRPWRSHLGHGMPNDIARTPAMSALQTEGVIISATIADQVAFWMSRVVELERRHRQQEAPAPSPCDDSDMHTGLDIMVESMARYSELNSQGILNPNISIYIYIIYIYIYIYIYLCLPST